jgi:ABC-type lipoprotein release transport system permease subunit
VNSFLLAIRLATRNVAAYWVKNLIVGAILAFGTMIVVTGSALLDSLDVAMRKSITTSVTGDLQVYASDARDPLQMLGDSNFGGSDNGEIADYRAIEAALENVPEVQETLPMGIANATVFGANDIDRVLEELRAAVRDNDMARGDVLLERVRRISADIAPELDRIATITSDQQKVDDDKASVARVASETFLTEFHADPLGTVDWLDSNIAPLDTNSRLAYLRLLGTDIDAFARTFPRMQLTEGAMVPTGERGIILNETMMEQWIKNILAREFDEDHETIGTSGTLYDRVQRNSRQYRRILYQLDPAEADALLPKLQALLGSQTSDLASLLKDFLAVSDETIEVRYKFFYDEIAPNIRLYDINVGDTLPLRSFTKSGYLKSVNVKVYGIYRYRGVEDGDQAAGAYCLIDMLSFRDLYGKMTESQLAELSDIKASMDAMPASSGNLDEAFFGGGEALETTAQSSAGALSALATNAAIILKNPDDAAGGLKAVDAALKAAKLPVQVVDWKSAAGLLGQFVTVVQIVVFTGVGVMFLVAMVIINNALVMATLERTGEIGTMRAVGAQRGFVIWLFVLETVIVGLLAGSVGAGVAASIVHALHDSGIPAGVDFLTILFGGKALYPELHSSNVLLGFGMVTVVSAIATIYPAMLAAGVPPVVALQGKE